MRLLSTALVLTAALAAAQDPSSEFAPPPTSAPPLVPTSQLEADAERLLAPAPAPVVAPEAVPAPVAAPNERQPTYWERCFAVPAQVWVPGPHGRWVYFGAGANVPVGGGTSASATPPPNEFHGARPVGSPGGSGPRGGGGAPSGGGGGSFDGKALLVLAVVLVAALPIIVYAVDEDAPEVVRQRFHCPSFGFDAYGGVDVGNWVGGPVGSGTGRATFGFGYLGGDFQFDLSAGALNAYAAHLMLRIAPKSHLEPNLAFGYRRMALGGQVRHGLEVGVPHRYVLWRDNLRFLALELRPTFTFGLGTFDVGLEAGVLIPLVEPLHLRVGGKVQSFGDEVLGGVNAGLSFSL